MSDAFDTHLQHCLRQHEECRATHDRVARVEGMVIQMHAKLCPPPVPALPPATPSEPQDKEPRVPWRVWLYGGLLIVLIVLAAVDPMLAAHLVKAVTK